MDAALVLATWFVEFAAAVLPGLNAELLMLALFPVAAARGEVLLLAVTAIAGQMVGKAAIYWLTRREATRLNTSHRRRSVCERPTGAGSRAIDVRQSGASSDCAPFPRTIGTDETFVQSETAALVSAQHLANQRDVSGGSGPRIEHPKGGRAPPVILAGPV